MSEVMIFLSNRGVAFVDRQDYPRVSPYRWFLQRSGTKAYAYARLAPGQHNRPVSMHRFLMKATPGTLVDHANGDGLDNRRSANLRFATFRQNSQNRAKHPRSSFKGVARLKSGLWRSTITVDGKKILLGDFDTAHQAAYAYDLAAPKHFGQFARLNNAEPISLTRRDVSRVNTSGFRGVSWHVSQRRWIASYQGRFVGYFDTPEAAGLAATQARQAGGVTPKTLQANNTSGYRGVSLHKPGLWRAQVTIDRKRTYLGLHPTPEAAARAYDAAVIAHAIPRAALNFIDHNHSTSPENA